MDGHCPGVLDLVEHLKAVGRELIIVGHDEQLRLRIDRHDPADVTVEHTESAGDSCGVF